MESTVILLIVLAVLMNIKAGLVIWHYKQKNRELNEEKEAIQQNMMDFVEAVERENEELYAKLVGHIKAKESNFENRIRLLEESANGADAQESDRNKLAAIEPAEQPASQADQPMGEKIDQLFKQGFSVNQIAKVLKADRGAVELTVNLLEKKKNYQK